MLDIDNLPLSIENECHICGEPQEDTCETCDKPICKDHKTRIPSIRLTRDVIYAGAYMTICATCRKTDPRVFRSVAA